MQPNEAIKKSLDYIERNLKTIITIEELAKTNREMFAYVVDSKERISKVF